MERELFSQILKDPVYWKVLDRVLSTHGVCLEKLNTARMDLWIRLCIALGSNLTPFETFLCSLRLFLYAASLAYFAPARFEPDA